MYRDLHQHLALLEEKGLLLRVKQPIQKETEIHTLVRWQYRGGIPEAQRKAWLFEDVFDAQGRHYKIPVTVGALAGSPQIYALGLDTDVDGIEKVWQTAFRNPIAPVIVEQGRVQEEVHLGDDVKRLGFEEFPTPISTPGFDNAPYTTCTHWFTKDPETGIRNVGNYRGHIKARDRIGVYPMMGQHIIIHWDKAKAKGQPLQAALVVGAPPVVSYAAVQKVPFGVDELAIAGGLARQPIPLVKCKTVDIEVPADAEIVFEGLISTEWLEPEGPFGESHGYMHPRQYNPFMDVTAVTHRKDAIWVSWISQVTPSESSVIKKSGYETMFYEHLRYTCSIKSVKRVVMHEPLTNLRKFIVIQMSKPGETDVWRALHQAATFHQGVGKIVVAVDEDIDPTNTDAVLWAMCYRMKPHLDVHIISGMEKGHGPPFKFNEEGTEDVISFYNPANDSAMLINAIQKEPLPPISLPKREYMEHAKEIWEELGLPPIKEEPPWYGYSLGQWSEELDEEAKLAVEGRHFETGEKLKARRRRA
ncbi:MAG: UbiD family decarboxylase [Chloroflexi bacterium]|nr:UbiD family decarboxylase [Chloroflexota bacterium]MCL5952295.1 UbiD family decarboxylase [Chloroflexota bacterium]